jgi:hypothetical protein
MGVSFLLKLGGPGDRFGNSSREYDLNHPFRE